MNNKEERKTKCTQCKLYHWDFELEREHIAFLSLIMLDQIAKSLCDLGLAYEVQRENEVCAYFTPKDCGVEQ